MLLQEIAANYPHSYLSVIDEDLTVGFTAGQEFKKQNLDPGSFVGLTLEQIFGEYAPLVRENYLKTFEGAETEFELYINNQHQLYRTVPLKNQDRAVDAGDLGAGELLVFRRLVALGVLANWL